MRKVLTGLIAAVMLPVAANAASFVNGGFEDGQDPGVAFTKLDAGSPAITGWTIGGNSIDYIGGLWKPSEGLRSIDLSGDNAGSISQTFDTVANQRYRVRYDLAGNPDGGDRFKSLSVSATGNAADTQMFDTAGVSRSNMNWSTRTYNFVASGSSTTLSFLSNVGGAYGPAIDNVSVSAAGVPEPATWAMMIGGLGLVGGSMRRRRTAARTFA